MNRAGREGENGRQGLDGCVLQRAATCSSVAKCKENNSRPCDQEAVIESDKCLHQHSADRHFTCLSVLQSSIGRSLAFESLSWRTKK